MPKHFTTVPTNHNVFRVTTLLAASGMLLGFIGMGVGIALHDTSTIVLTATLSPCLGGILTGAGLVGVHYQWKDILAYRAAHPGRSLEADWVHQEETNARIDRIGDRVVQLLQEDRVRLTWFPSFSNNATSDQVSSMVRSEVYNAIFAKQGGDIGAVPDNQLVSGINVETVSQAIKRSLNLAQNSDFLAASVDGKRNLIQNMFNNPAHAGLLPTGRALGAAQNAAVPNYVNVPGAGAALEAGLAANPPQPAVAKQLARQASVQNASAAIDV